MCGFYGVSGVIEKAVTHELDGTAIAQGGDLRVKRELIEHLEVVLCRDLVDVAFAVNLERLTAARARSSFSPFRPLWRRSWRRAPAGR